MTDLERKVLNLLKYHREQHPDTYKILNDDLKNTGIRVADVRVLCVDFRKDGRADVTDDFIPLQAHDPNGSGMIYDGLGPPIKMKLTSVGLKSLDDDANAMRSVQLGDREWKGFKLVVGLTIASLVVSVVALAVAIAQLRAQLQEQSSRSVAPTEATTTDQSAKPEQALQKNALAGSLDTATRESVYAICGPCPSDPAP